jgi:hypothetical protein
MSRFFINRPIVAMLISMLLVIVGAITIAALPVAPFPAIASLGSADPGDLLLAGGDEGISQCRGIPADQIIATNYGRER